MKAEPRIRRMLAPDAIAVSALLGESWTGEIGPLVGVEKAAKVTALWHAPDKLASQAGSPGLVALVAETQDGAIAGHALAAFDKDGRAWLHRLYIASAHFGGGLAGALLRAILGELGDPASLDLEVVEGNARAIAFYRKHGFVEVGRRGPEENEQGLAVTLMRRRRLEA